jgi:curved DNA-binding protein CbpA
METKSLYTILGVRPDASADQIETAYAQLLHELKTEAETSANGDARIRLIAAKEAHTILSNPTSRQIYNQKLFAPQTVGRTPEIVMEPADTWSVGKLLAIGSFAVAGFWIYNNYASEQEKLHLQHEKEVAETQAKLEEERIAQQKRDLLAQKEAQERAFRENALRESRELDQRLQQQEREQQSRQMQADREKVYRQQQEEMRLRQQRYEAERQLEREKQTLRRIQNENRSNYRY